MKKIFSFTLLGALLAFLILPGTTNAQGVRPGVRLGVYTDAGDLFIGGELLIPTYSNFVFNPNIEYVFVENGSYLTFNGDFHYDIYMQDSPLFVWLGAGLAVLYFNPEGNRDSNADVGANLLFGLGWETASRLIPYVQGKVILSDNTEFALGFGIRF